MNRFEQIRAMHRERADAAATYLHLMKAGRTVEAQPYGDRAKTLALEIGKIVRTLKATEPGGYRHKIV